ncbi:hypothetical protein TPA0905_09510 [Streptomyces olivaceus]|nr:hypothetical protein TPA0905_09510 [Streptomyces olivaceus]
MTLSDAPQAAAAAGDAPKTTDPPARTEAATPAVSQLRGPTRFFNDLFLCSVVRRTGYLPPAPIPVTAVKAP